MLQMDISHAFVALVTVFLAVLLCLSLYDSWRARSRGWTMAEETLGECSKCRCVFLVNRYETTVRCPRCETAVQVTGRAGNGSRGKSR